MPNTSRLSGLAVMQANLGIWVQQRSGSMAATPQILFDVTGKVAINLLIGEVTTVIATTTTLLLELTTGTVQMCAATTITADAVGSMYYFSGDQNAILSVDDDEVVGIASLGVATSGNPPMVVGLSPLGVNAASSIQHHLDGAGTGNIQWDLWYTPLSIGAKVLAH